MNDTSYWNQVQWICNHFFYWHLLLLVLVSFVKCKILRASLVWKSFKYLNKYKSVNSLPLAIQRFLHREFLILLMIKYLLRYFTRWKIHLNSFIKANIKIESSNESGDCCLFSLLMLMQTQIIMWLPKCLLIIQQISIVSFLLSPDDAHFSLSCSFILLSSWQTKQKICFEHSERIESWPSSRHQI